MNVTIEVVTVELPLAFETEKRLDSLGDLPLFGGLLLFTSSGIEPSRAAAGPVRRVASVAEMRPRCPAVRPGCAKALFLDVKTVAAALRDHVCSAWLARHESHFPEEIRCLDGRDDMTAAPHIDRAGGEYVEPIASGASAHDGLARGIGGLRDRVGDLLALLLGQTTK